MFVINRIVKMLLSLCCVLCYIVAFVRSNDIGPGVWAVQHIEKCELDHFKFKFDLGMKRINRTHDGFYGKIILEEEIDDTYGILIDICKNVDGGCKTYQRMAESSLIDFVNKYAEQNCKNFLELAGFDPPEFPLKKGEYEAENFIFNYDELPSDGPYGSYVAQVFVMKNTLEESCLEIHVEFNKKEDEECDDD